MIITLCFCLTAILASGFALHAENKIPEECKTGGFFIGYLRPIRSIIITVFEAIEKTATPPAGRRWWRWCGGGVHRDHGGQKLSKEEPDVAWDHNASPEVIQKVKDKLAEYKIKAVNYGVVGIPEGRSARAQNGPDCQNHGPARRHHRIRGRH